MAETAVLLISYINLGAAPSETLIFHGTIILQTEESTVRVAGTADQPVSNKTISVRREGNATSEILMDKM